MPVKYQHSISKIRNVGFQNEDNAGQYRSVVQGLSARVPKSSFLHRQQELDQIP
jgi:hypothetical protein